VFALSYKKAAFADVEALYAEFGTSSSGLSIDEAKNRLGKCGPNIIPSAKKASVVGRSVGEFKNLFNVLLLFASFLSFLSGFVYNDVGSVQISLAIFIVVVVNVVFSLIQEFRAEKAVEALRRLVPANAKVVRDNSMVQVSTSEVVPGDIIVLEEGDRVSADVRLITAFEVSVDNSVLTGESEPQRRFSTMMPNTVVEGISDYQNIVFAGTTIASGAARGIVLSTGKDTEFGKIVSIAREIKDPLSPLQKEIDYTAKINFIVAVIVASSFFVVTFAFLNLTPIESLLFSIGVMVSLVPEGFQVTVSLALALGALAMSKRKVIVKRLSAVETLGSTTVICVDKTGTITSGEMFVKKVWASGRIFEVTGDGYKPEGFATIDGRRVNEFERPHIFKLFQAAAFVNNAQLIPPSDRILKWTVLGDTTDAALLVFSGKGDFNIKEASVENPRIFLIPFDSGRKMMTSIHKSTLGEVTAYTKGAPFEVLSKCTTIFYDNKVIGLDYNMREAIKQQINKFASETFRVLALAVKPLRTEQKEFLSKEVEKDLTFLGLVAIYDPPRPDVEKAVQKARNAGMRVIMITGDHELTAEAIAENVGIVSSSDHVLVSGSELAELSDEQLSKILNTHEIVFARTAPEQKLRIVRTLKSKGEIVTVTGDGVNDSPALLEAHVGIAMGVTGTDVTRESADMVLLDDNFASIVNGIELGRAVFDNLKRFVYYVFVHNMAELITFVAFVLFNLPLPLLVAQVLAIDLGMDLLPSLAITLEPPKPHVMLKPPRRLGTRLIDLKTLFRAFYIGSIISLWALMGAFSKWAQAGWTFGQSSVADPLIYARGTTMVMAGIIAAQLGTLLAARTNLEPALKLNPLRNRWLSIGILSQLSIMMIIIYVPFFNNLFGTAPLSLSDWIYLYSFAPVIFILEEIRKAILRHRNNK